MLAMTLAAAIIPLWAMEDFPWAVALPGVERCSGCIAVDVHMGRGYLPAHVSHVGGAASAIPAVPVYDEIPERRFQKLLFPVAGADICGDGLKPFLIQLGDHGLEFPRIIQFLLRVSNGDHTLQIFLDQIIESLVVDQVRISGHLFDIHGGAVIRAAPLAMSHMRSNSFCTWVTLGARMA